MSGGTGLKWDEQNDYCCSNCLKPFSLRLLVKRKAVTWTNIRSHAN